MTYIDNFNDFKRLSTVYFRESKEIKKVEEQIEREFDCGIRNYRYFDFKRDCINSAELKRIETTGGLTFKVGKCGYYKFDDDPEKIPDSQLFRKHRELVDRHYEYGQKLKDMTGNQYPHAKIGERSFKLELTSSYWGFTVRDDVDKLTVDDIIYIEEHSEAKFLDRDVFGVSFKWDMEDIE